MTGTIGIKTIADAEPITGLLLRQGERPTAMDLDPAHYKQALDFLSPPLRNLVDSKKPHQFAVPVLALVGVDPVAAVNN